MHNIIHNDVVHDLHLHASDFLPNTAQTKQIRSVVQVQNSTVHALDAQISFLEAQLCDLRAQRIALIESSTVKKALLAPIRKLAPETLGEVFELASNGSITPGVQRIITADCTPILLGMVCRKWRRVAQGTPQLWTTIALERTTELTKKVNPFIVIPEWLSRSGCLPVDIYLGDGLEKLLISGRHMNAFRSCMEVLGDHFHRCRSFHVTNAFPNVLAALFPLGRCRDASSLRDFRVIPSTSALPQRPLVLGQITAPNLENIDVHRPSTFFHSMALDYSQLRSLRWNTFLSSNDRESSLEALTQVLGLCPNLEECEIVHPSHSTSSLDKSSIVSVPSLRRLRLKFTLQRDPSPLLSVLRTPGLESLTLEHTSPISNVPGFGGALSTFISAGMMPLKELRLTRLILSAEDAVLFTSLSRLESLHLSQCFMHPAFVDALTPKRDVHPDTWVAPKLSSISMTSSAFPEGTLPEMLEQRLARPDVLNMDASYRPRLKSLSLLACRLSDADGIALTRLTEVYEGFCVNMNQSRCK
ncbi:hypothetical protein K439DRAFT_1658866 [Ramaria rubella]|nr:hypothetical protein K439DRAFT_1658866 [Ramaria rubella]